MSDYKDYKFAEIILPYFKQSDDFQHYLDEWKDIGAALSEHAEAMISAANTLREVKAIVEGQDVLMQGMTHMISIEGPAHVIDKLVEKQLAKEPPRYDDEEDGDDVPEKGQG